MNTEMAKGIMLTKATECTDNDDMIDGLVFDLDLPLRKILKSMFQHPSRVIIDFPGISDEQVKEYADYIAKMVTPEPIEVQMVETFIKTDSGIPKYVKKYIKQIKEIMAGYKISPSVDPVRLVTQSYEEVLTVDNNNVLYKRYKEEDLDDTSAFLRVYYFTKEISHFVIIWINLSTLFPIGRQRGGNNQLYSITPETNIYPVIQPNSANAVTVPYQDIPFSWLRAIVEKPERYADICLFQQQGTMLSIIYPVKNPPKTTGKPRISKGTGDVAVINQSYLKFVVLDYEKSDERPSVIFEDGMMDSVIVKWITFVSIVFVYLLFM